jgi:hypothetical protein
MYRYYGIVAPFQMMYAIAPTIECVLCVRLFLIEVDT